MVCKIFFACVGNVEATDIDAEMLKQEAESADVDDTFFEAVSDLQIGSISDETVDNFTAAAAVDNQSSSATEPSFSKAVSVVDLSECKKNSAAPVMNGALESDSDETHICSTRPLSGSDASPDLHERNISSLTLSDNVESGDHSNQQPPVSPGDRDTEPNSEAGFTAVVRKRRKDAGAKPKTQQSEDLSLFWHRKPARPAYISPKSSVHHSAGRLSPTHMQPISQKSANPSAVGLWDSTPSAFPALPSLRVRRNSAGDVRPTSSESNDSSDLESVKSVQSYTGRQIAWGHSQGSSSYASIVIGKVSNREPVSQPSFDILPKSPLSDAGVDIIPSHSHGSDHSTFEESIVSTSPVEPASVTQGSLPAAFGSSDFMVESSISIQEDESSKEDNVSCSNRQAHSESHPCAHGSRRRHVTLFFDTRSKSLSTPVPSFDISFGFDDDTVVAEAVSSHNVIVTSELDTTGFNDTVSVEAITSHHQIIAGELETTTAFTSRISQAEPTSNVEFFQQPSVTYSLSTSSRTSTAAVLRSLFDLRAAQRYLLSGKSLTFGVQLLIKIASFLQ